MLLPMQSTERPPAGTGSGAAPAPAPAAGREAAVDACLVAAGVGGASLLAWWAVAFHPSNSMLWMVPVGLVLACTPPLVCLALSSSSAGAAAGAHVPPLSAVVVHK